MQTGNNLHSQSSQVLILKELPLAEEKNMQAQVHS